MSCMRPCVMTYWENHDSVQFQRAKRSGYDHDVAGLGLESFTPLYLCTLPSFTIARLRRSCSSGSSSSGAPTCVFWNLTACSFSARCGSLSGPCTRGRRVHEEQHSSPIPVPGPANSGKPHRSAARHQASGTVVPVSLPEPSPH
jgi:hypothetical protein